MTNPTDKANPGHTKDFTVIVNGREKTVTSKELTFAQVVALAFESPPTGPNILFTITYRKGDNEHKPEGTMVEGGDPVKVKDGMIFNVTATDKS
jgi:Multiubiquitin